MSETNAEQTDAIAFVERYASSEQFRSFFQEGMALVEQTADYLDGEGRAASKTLPRPTSMLYASESMRLTTRLMQVSSWLLLQRAVNEGELTVPQVLEEKRKVSLDTLLPSSSDPSYDELPDGLTKLIDRSLSLHRRVKRLDEHLYSQAEIPVAPISENPVHQSMNRISNAFQTR
ncbi:MAG: DUF1465 family protein [Pseudomonadota bacterium]